MASKGGALMINFMNIVMELVITLIFRQVLFPTLSRFELATGKFVFVAQFTNLGFLVLLLIANLEYQNNPFLYRTLFHESKTDFD